MTTKTFTQYFPKIKGGSGYFSPDGFSKGGSNYGYEECLQHIAELREKVYMGRKPYEHSEFQIMVETTVETTFDIK